MAELNNSSVPRTSREGSSWPRSRSRSQSRSQSRSLSRSQSRSLSRSQSWSWSRPLLLQGQFPSNRNKEKVICERVRRKPTKIFKRIPLLSNTVSSRGVTCMLVDGCATTELKHSLRYLLCHHSDNNRPAQTS